MEKKYSVYVRYDDGSEYKIVKHKSWEKANEYVKKHSFDEGIVNKAMLVIVEDEPIAKAIKTDKILDVFISHMHGLRDDIEVCEEGIELDGPYTDTFREIKSKKIEAYSELLGVLHDLELMD